MASVCTTYFTGTKRGELKTNFLVTYDGKKAPGLDFLVQNGHKGQVIYGQRSVSSK